MSNKILAYLRLFRLPNVFTAMADVGMGLFFTASGLNFAASGLGHLTPRADLLGLTLSLLAASSLIYTAGMILNDVFDVNVDLKERPERPLPSGAISLGWARSLGFGFLLLGTTIAWIAGCLYHAPDTPWWRVGAVATALSAMVLLYDGGLKKTVVGPVAMGGCRLLNILLAMSAASPRLPDSRLFLSFDASQWLVAGGIGVYIAGVTWFARTEATESRRGSLRAGMIVMGVGIVMLAIFPRVGAFDLVEGEGANPPMQFYLGQPDSMLWPLLLLIYCVSLFRRLAGVIADPQPRSVQLAVKQSIFSLVLFDASIAMVVAGPVAGVVVVALLLPMLFLGRWVYST